MNIYFSGIGGVGIGPLAQIARDASNTIVGSDAQASVITDELVREGVRVSTDQTGAFLQQCHSEKPIDWFVYTAALPDDHPELLLAQSLGIRIAKRDELLNEIITANNLKLIAIAGTHGKTTTAGLLVWVMHQLGISISYSVGTTLSYGPSGKYDPLSQYFVYECDEFDRNLLHFSPHLTILTSIDYDHPDTYPTQADYSAAFTEFLHKSRQSIMWQHDTVINVTPPAGSWVLSDDEVMDIRLAGQHNRANATLLMKAFEFLKLSDPETVQQAIESFPGTGRRFEKLADGLYSDYGHHPVEIGATLQMAREVSDHVVLVYQPHQNTRQHEVRSGYTSCMELAEKVYWLPTYQSRENLDLPILSPEQLTERMTNREIVEYADLNDELWAKIQQERAAGKLVLCMGAGTIDTWVREQLTKQ